MPKYHENLFWVIISLNNSHELTAGNLKIIKSRNMECISTIVVCEQAFWGALVAGQEKEGELATMSLEFQYLHGKSRCEMLNALPSTRVFQCLFKFVLVSTVR